jgi:hypothetical protein
LTGKYAGPVLPAAIPSCIAEQHAVIVRVIARDSAAASK